MVLNHITLFYTLGGLLKGATLLRAILFPYHVFLRQSHGSVTTRANLFPNHVFLRHPHGSITTRAILFPTKSSSGTPQFTTAAALYLTHGRLA